ncbi:BTAD domain-containing putative transcriptional regulator [Actinophytocola sp.]|uniref:AfsR/SARP family transcriptional regulator n=1 Tax=Actinophytocola sp. TaxID=1872138 RepID=UPI00389AF652
MLAVLALNANRVTAVEQLVDAVWGMDPPPTARPQIQTCVSALRRLLADNECPAEIRTRLPGYVLEIGDEQLDSKRFNLLLDNARAAERDGRLPEALETLRTALALWRGPVLADVPSDVVLRLSAGLGERRISAEIARMRVELALGRHREIIPDLQALVREHPLREELYGYYMLALYRSGRQTEALEVYRQARTLLVEEIGLEPSAELRELERAILNRDENLTFWMGAQARGDGSAVAASTPMRFVVPGQLPAAIADFTGREEELTEIVGLLSADPASAPFVPVVAVSGGGGIGKSTLAIAAAHRLRERFPDGQLFANLANEEDGTRGVQDRFLRALGIPCAVIPVSTAARTDLYRSRLAGQRILVVLDDVASEDQALSLLPGTAGCAAIVTSRSRLGGLPGARLIDLAELDFDQSMALLTRIMGEERIEADPHAAAELVRICAGLPLALRIIGARLVTKPHWSLSGLLDRLADESRMLDEFSHGSLELRSNLGVSYRDLSPAEQRLFRRLSLIEAHEFPAWAAAALLDTDTETAVGALENLVDAQLAAADGPPRKPAAYRFHRLVRAFAREQVLAEEPANERDRTVERWLGAWLHRVEEVHRQEYGGDYTILHGTARRWHPPDGDREATLTTLVEERHMLVAAIRQAAEAGYDELSWDLALSSVTLFETRGFYDDWRDTTQVALAAVKRAGNRRGQAALQYALGALELACHHVEDAGRELSTALDLFTEEGDRHGRGLALRYLAYVDRLHGDIPLTLARFEEALALLRSVGDRMGEAYVLCSLASHWLTEGERQRAKSLLDEALSISVAAGCRRGEAQALAGLAYYHIACDELDRADEVLNRALRVVRGLGDTTGETHVIYALGLTRQLESRVNHAELAFTHAIARAREAGERQVEIQGLHQLSTIYLARGDLIGAGARCAEALSIAKDLDVPVLEARVLMLSAQISAAAGDPARALAEARTAEEALTGLHTNEARNLLTKLRRQLSLLNGDGNGVAGPTRHDRG